MKTEVKCNNTDITKCSIYGAHGLFFFLLHIYYINLLLTNQWNSNAISDNITCILHWTSKYLEGFMCSVFINQTKINY